MRSREKSFGRFIPVHQREAVGRAITLGHVEVAQVAELQELRRRAD